MHRPGDPRRRGRRDQRAAQEQAAALEAKEAAAQAFYELDQAQKYVSGRLTLLADLDRGAADRLRPAFAEADRRANEAALAYITVVDAHDLDSPSRTVAEYDSGRRALLGVTETLRLIKAELDRVSTLIAPELARLESRLDELTPRLRAAREAFTQAQGAVARAEEAGMATQEVRGELTAVQESLTELTGAGLGGLGLAGALARAEEVTRRAAAVAEEAAGLAVAVQKTRNDLASVRTRIEMVSGRREQVERAMSTLRRRYTTACWQDLQGASAAIEQALERALERVFETEQAATAQNWREVSRCLAAARTELKDAERRARSVTDRVADLEAAEREPGRPLEQARFAVRDAQRLAVAAPGGPQPRHAQILDALVERLERVPGLLHGTHPDYWAYLSELRAISTQAHDVVEAIRSERAG